MLSESFLEAEAMKAGCLAMSVHKMSSLILRSSVLFLKCVWLRSHFRRVLLRQHVGEDVVIAIMENFAKGREVMVLKRARITVQNVQRVARIF